jgi:hypothetical protein
MDSQRLLFLFCLSSLVRCSTALKRRPNPSFFPSFVRCDGVRVSHSLKPCASLLLFFLLFALPVTPGFWGAQCYAAEFF